MSEPGLADVVLELRRVADEQAHLHRRFDDLLAALVRKRPNADHAGAWLAALRCGWGTQVFTCSALIGWAEQEATTQQRDVLAATRVLCRLHAGADLTSAKLSAALRRLPPGQIEVAGSRRGSTLWAIVDSRG